MNTEEKLQKMRDELAALEKQAAKEAKEKLLALPASVGLRTVAELVTALLPYAKGLKRPAKAGAPAKAARVAKKAGKRAKITDETRKAILDDLKGGATAAAAAAKHGVSVPSVNLIKSAAGLVKKRKKK